MIGKLPALTLLAIQVGMGLVMAVGPKAPPLKSGFSRPPARSSSVGARNALQAFDFDRACERIAGRSREDLLAVALARGCWHYATLWPESLVKDDPTLPHEALACALLRGPADALTFQAIRCGAMVLSDLNNAPERIARAAKRLAVVKRVAHIARLGAAHDGNLEF